MADSRLLVLQVAALGYDFLCKNANATQFNGYDVYALESLFPALTCPVQATMRTGMLPYAHGMVMNGTYSRNLKKPMFWEQSSALVEGPRIWTNMREHGKKVGMLFWQQSLGEDIDVLLSPAPIHTHGGGMIEDVYSQPENLYARLVTRMKKKFKLSSYWGPLASRKSSEWITHATIEIMSDSDSAPDVLFSYIPHLDYALQKYGPHSSKAREAYIKVESLLVQLIETARQNGYEILVYGDYAMGEVDHAEFPNRLLVQHGFLHTRNIKGKLYPDWYASDAFAVVDHEIAHVYTRNPHVSDAVVSLFSECSGIDMILTGDAKKEYAIHHPLSGDIVLTSAENTWFAYPWWSNSRNAPDYASHIDIHNKPGYDPCELFFGKHPFAVSSDTSKIRGSHGKNINGRECAIFSTLDVFDGMTFIDVCSRITTCME